MSVTGKKSVELFYDVVSPYSWIAFETLCRYRQKWNIDLKLKPVFLGGIMKGSDNRPPGSNPSKAIHLNTDVQRLGQHYKIPIKVPSDPAKVLFEKGSLPTMRFVTAIDIADSKLTEAVSRQLWMRIWSRDQDIIEPSSISEAAKAAGLSEQLIKEALTASKGDKVKERLKSYTQEALDHGAFGAPTIVLEDKSGNKQMVFGSDRMHIIADLLGEQYDGPLTELAAKL